MAINKPLMLLQGEWDTFGKREESSSYNLSTQVKVSYLTDSEHSFKLRKVSFFMFDDQINLAIIQTAEFIKSHV